MNQSADSRTRFQRLKPLLLKSAGYAAIALTLLAGLFFASKRSLAALDAQNGRAHSEARVAPAPGDNNLITVTVRTTAVDGSGMPLELRAGVAYGDRVAYWRDAMPIAGATPSADAVEINTVLASRKSGEVIFAVGPLPEGSRRAQASASGSVRGSVVWIEDRPFAIVHRRPVEDIIDMKSRAFATTDFSEASLGLYGEIELRQAS